MQTPKPKIFVTGAHGQLGCELQAIAADYPYDFFFFSRATMPIEDSDALNV